jgi:O-antigen/teichoic acid export membrane protein
MDERVSPEPIGPSPGGGAPAAGVKKGSGGFAGNVLALSGGTAVAQAITIAAVPITTRLFAPEAFGVAAVFIATVTLLLGAGCLRYELAIPLPRDDADAANLLVLCLLILAGVTGLVALAVGVLGPGAFQRVGAGELASCRWLVPPAVFLTGLVFPLRYWNTRHGQYKRLAWSRILGAAAGVGATLTLGFAGWNRGGHLVLAKTAALAVGSGLLAWWCWRSDLGFVLRHGSVGDVRRLARRYVKFPLLSSGSSFLHVGSKQLPAIVLVGFFGTAAVGFYGRAYVLVMLPMMLIGACVQQVFFQRSAAQRAAGEPLAPLVEGVSRRLIALTVLPSAVVALIGPELFLVVCGPGWAEAGVYARILSPLLFVFGVCWPVSTLTSTLERQGVELVVVAFLFVAQLGALVVGGAAIGDVRWALVLFTLAGVVAYAGLYAYLLGATGASMRRMARHTVRCSAYAVPTAAVGAVAKWALGLSAWPVVGLVAAASLSYWLAAARGDAVAVALWNRARGNLRAALRMAKSG